jgi:hypothetical protein
MKFFLLLLLAAPLLAQADGTQPDGSGSPDWFSWSDFAAGCAAAWVIVGPMFVYWVMKRSAGDALG